MTIGRDEVLHIAKLAELAVDEADVATLAAQLDRIVGYVAQLDSLPPEPGEPRPLPWSRRVCASAGPVAGEGSRTLTVRHRTNARWSSGSDRSAGRAADHNHVPCRGA